MSLQHSLPFPCGQPAALTPVAGEWYSRVGDWELGVQAATVAVTDFRLGYKYGEMFSNHPNTQPFVPVYVCVSLSWSMLCLLVLATPRVSSRSSPRGLPLAVSITVPADLPIQSQHLPLVPADCQVMLLHETDLLPQSKSSYRGFCFSTILRIITFSVFFNMVFLLYACNAGWGICDVILSKWSQTPTSSS